MIDIRFIQRIDTIKIIIKVLQLESNTKTFNYKIKHFFHRFIGIFTLVLLKTLIIILSQNSVFIPFSISYQKIFFTSNQFIDFF
jgi:hypothetical protein